MKMNIKRTVGAVLLAFIGFAGMTSCSEDFPSNVESDLYTDLKSIKILNSGPNGDQVLEGVVNQSLKTISFPRLDTLTDFSAIKFEAVTSDGSKLEEDTFSIPYQSGDSQRDLFLKVVNLPRFKEYKAVIRFKVPVYGADFSKGIITDYSQNPLGNPTYPAFVSGLTRGSGFNGSQVLVISRGASGIHLLNVADLKKNEIKPIQLNTNGITGGTLTVNMGGLVKNHIYVANLSGAAASPLKLYHWDDPAKEPQVIANINVGSLAGAGARHGDNFSIGLDDNGNGYAFFISQQGPVIRLKIDGYSNVSETKVINTAAVYGQWSSFNRIGNSDNYLFTGHDKPISLGNNAGGASYTMNTKSVPVYGGDARVVEFNGQRYLLVVTIPRGAPAVDSKILVYNITKGSNMFDALTAFEQGVTTPVFEFVLSGNTNISPGTQSGFHVIKDADGKDEKLVIYGASSDYGFAIAEFPVNVLVD